MDLDRWRLIQTHFDEVLRRPPDERAAYLDRACAADDALRAEVLALLEAAPTEAGDPVAEIVGAAAESFVERARSSNVGLRLGPWRLIRHLADGGMGSVWLAERADGRYQQEVALKLLSPALMSPDARVRFEAERRILARLDHPNLARLLDGGETEDGLPYLVMQYVDGLPIDVHVRQARLDTAARLRLFRQVCEVVIYAHRNLVVHRDIKPGNILVDREGRPVLLDFGIAKLIEGSEGDLTLTGQRVFTPTHSSPEQIRGEAVTTATDVYGLGVLLYQLLSGQLPFPGAGRTPAQIARDVLEKDPPRPSTVAGQTPTPAATPPGEPAPGRAPDAARLGRELRGDLDNIVLMALRKDPERRYPSVAALAADIDNVLLHRPVSARADTWRYRARKYVRRHRAGVGAGVGMTLTVLALVTGYTWQLGLARDRAESAREEAVAEARRATRTAQLLENLFADTDPERSRQRQVTAVELLQRGAARIGAELHDQPVLHARLLRTIGKAFEALGDYEQAHAHIERAVRLLDQPAQRAAHCEMVLELGRLLIVMSRHDEAEPVLQACVREPAVADELDRNEARIVQALAAIDRTRLDFGRAEQRARTALAALTRLAGADSADVFEALTDLGYILGNAGRFAAALELCHRRLAMATRLFGDDSVTVSRVLASLANLQRTIGQFEAAVGNTARALALVERLHAPDSVRVAHALSAHAQSLAMVGQMAEAAALDERALATYRRAFGDRNPWTLEQTRQLASDYRQLGRAADAEATLAPALAGRDESVPDLERGERARAVETLAGLREDRRQWADAERLYRRALALLQSDPTGWAALRVKESLAWMLGRQGRLAEGESVYRELAATSARLHATELPQEYARLLETYAEWLDMTGQRARAAALRARHRRDIAAGADYIARMREVEQREQAAASRAGAPGR